MHRDVNQKYDYDDDDTEALNKTVAISAEATTSIVVKFIKTGNFEEPFLKH